VFASFIVVICLMAWAIVPPIAQQINDKDKRDAFGENVMHALDGIKEQAWVAYLLEHHDTANTAPPSTKDELKTGTLKTGQPAAEEGAGTAKKAEKIPFSNTRLAKLLPDDMGNKVGDWLQGGTTKLLGFFGLLLGFAMSPIYLYYFLKESSGIKAHWHEYVPLKASHFKTEVIETLQEINGYLISFFRGQVLVAFIDGLLVGIALWIFGLPYGLIIGLFMAVLGVIPYIGNILCLIPACIIAYVHFGFPDNQNFIGDNPWFYVGAVVAIFFIVQQINSLITAPKIVGDSVGLHPMTVIFSMLFWSLLLGGFIGALLAVPLTAAVKVLVRRYVWERKLNEPPTPPTEQEEPSEAEISNEPA
ncbi:MAG: AI-2E family transporter, partial [Akkermansiaceae bacterium]